jgi:HEAT repeat protein
MQEQASILTRLRSEDLDTRRVALTELDQIVESASLSDVLPLLVDDDPTVRRLAVAALEEMGDPKALPDLLKAIADSDPVVASSAQTATMQFRSPDSFDALLDGATDPAAKIRQAAAAALRGFKDPRVCEVLVGRIDDPAVLVRREVVLTLGRYKDASQALSALQTALKDDDQEVRRLAVDAISQSEDSNVFPLIRAARDRAWRVRRQAVIGLANYRSEEGETALVQALSDEHWEVVKEAIVSLGRLRTPISGELRRFFAHELADVRLAAAVATGQIGSSELESDLRTLSADPDTGVRKAAFRALQQLTETNGADRI